MKRSVISTMVLLISLSSSIWAQEPTTTPQAMTKNQRQLEESKMEVQKRGVGEHSKVTVFLKDRTEVKGYISQVDSESFQVIEKKSGRATAVAFSDVKKVRGGDSKTASIVIGLGVAGGILVGIAAAMLPRD